MASKASTPRRSGRSSPRRSRESLYLEFNKRYVEPIVRGQLYKLDIVGWNLVYDIAHSSYFVHYMIRVTGPDRNHPTSEAEEGKPVHYRTRSWYVSRRFSEIFEVYKTLSYHNVQGKFPGKGNLLGKVFQSSDHQYSDEFIKTRIKELQEWFDANMHFTKDADAYSPMLIFLAQERIDNFPTYVQPVDAFRDELKLEYMRKALAEQHSQEDVRAMTESLARSKVLCDRLKAENAELAKKMTESKRKLDICRRERDGIERREADLQRKFEKLAMRNASTPSSNERSSELQIDELLRTMKQLAGQMEESRAHLLASPIKTPSVDTKTTQHRDGTSPLPSLSTYLEGTLHADVASRDLKENLRSEWLTLGDRWTSSKDAYVATLRVAQESLRLQYRDVKRRWRLTQSAFDVQSRVEHERQEMCD